MAIITDRSKLSREKPTPKRLIIDFTDEVGIKIDDDLEWNVAKILENSGYDFHIREDALDFIDNFSGEE
jgi:hypothetical protein